jgi:hypothetical protein
VPRTKPAKKAPARRLTAAERARKSGFSRKLDLWLSANAKARDDGAISPGPHSCERLAKVITALGEPVTPATIYRWRDGRVLPESRYVPVLERLFGAPFSYLDDPKTPWPRPWTPEAVVDLVQRLSPEAVAELARDLQRALERSGGAPAPR